MCCVPSNGYTDCYCYFRFICHDLGLADDNKVFYLPLFEANRPLFRDIFSHI